MSLCAAKAISGTTTTTTNSTVQKTRQSIHPFLSPIAAVYGQPIRGMGRVESGSRQKQKTAGWATAGALT